MLGWLEHVEKMDLGFRIAKVSVKLGAGIPS